MLIKTPNTATERCPGFIRFKLNAAFNRLRAQAPDFPMPVWSALERLMPEADA